ncbi:hypothetical protein SLA2020_042010 [Shorea laevis]
MSQDISVQQLITNIDNNNLLVVQERNEYDEQEITSAVASHDVVRARECEEMSGEDDITSWMPHEGMQFPSEKEAHEFYNEYARRVGFSIRTESSKRSTSYGPVDRKYYVCYKAGKKRPYVPKYKPSCDRPVRVGCKARMSLHFKNGVWIIIHFVDEHNHELFSSPNKIRKLRSHNKEHLLQETRELMDQYKLAGCGPSKIARLLNVTG